MKRNTIIKIFAVLSYILFLIISFIYNFNPGKEMFHNFVFFLVDMLKILPSAFILIGLFEVWVKRETVEKHFGEKSGIRGYIGAILLSSTTVGGLYVSFPIAYSLCSKGAKLSIIFTYLGCSAICRIPMTIFEASFLGIKFTAIRLFVSLPLVIVTSILLGDYLTRKNYKIIEGK